jgi:hypothetical protein
MPRTGTMCSEKTRSPQLASTETTPPLVSASSNDCAKLDGSGRPIPVPQWTKSALLLALA